MAERNTREKYTFENTYKERFIENGIAEQDMVSTARGLLPVVNLFASFLASRANEQIYNNASETTKNYLCPALLRRFDTGQAEQVVSIPARKTPVFGIAQLYNPAAVQC